MHYMQESVVSLFFKESEWLHCTLLRLLGMTHNGSQLQEVKHRASGYSEQLRSLHGSFTQAPKQMFSGTQSLMIRPFWSRNNSKLLPQCLTMTQDASGWSGHVMPPQDCSFVETCCISQSSPMKPSQQLGVTWVTCTVTTSIWRVISFHVRLYNNRNRLVLAHKLQHYNTYCVVLIVMVSLHHLPSCGAWGLYFLKTAPSSWRLLRSVGRPSTAHKKQANNSDLIMTDISS